MWTSLFSLYRLNLQLLCSTSSKGESLVESILTSNPACLSAPASHLVPIEDFQMTCNHLIELKIILGLSCPLRREKAHYHIYRNIPRRVNFKRGVCEQSTDQVDQTRQVAPLMKWLSREFKVSRTNRFHPQRHSYFLGVLLLPNVCIYCFPLC